MVQEHILKDYPEAKTRVLHLDLSSLQSVKDFCVAFLELGLPLHILINNAGVAGCPFKLSQDGYELQFATNHLGHFLLTRLLLDHMKSSCPPGGGLEGRIVNVSSEAHKSSYKEGILPKDKLNCKSAYKPWKAYGQSKLANVYFSEKLDEELKKDGANIISTALMPGVIATDLSRHTAGLFVFFHCLLVLISFAKVISILIWHCYCSGQSLKASLEGPQQRYIVQLRKISKGEPITRITTFPLRSHIRTKISCERVCGTILSNM